jgi:hypothetical protein
MLKNNPVIYLFIYFCFLQSQHLQAQDLQLNAYGAYAFDDKVDSYYSNNSYFKGKLEGGFIWGAGLEYRLKENYAVELLYLRLDSEAPITYADGTTSTTSKTFNYGLNYIMLAGNRFMKLNNDKIEPYGGLLAGAAIINIKNPEPGGESTITRFAWGARVGSNIWLNPKLGIRLQAELLSATQAIGGGAYFGTGGSGVSVNSYSSMLQVNLGGGIIFLFPGKKEKQGTSTNVN